MKNILSFFLLLSIMKGVFGEAKLVSVMEGDSVTLHTGLTEIQSIKVIDWRSGDFRIAQINRPANMTETKDNELDGKFKGRLKLDGQTGDLTISNISSTDTGSYKVTITSTTKTSITFSLTGVSGGAVKLVSVLEGDSVTLKSDISDIQRYDVIQWHFKSQNYDVAKISIKDGNSSTYDGHDGRFRNRLKLDNQTGSLIITNTTTQHTGVYEVEISSTSGKHTIHKSLKLTVKEVMVSVSVLVGDSVTLHIDFTIIPKKHGVLWFDHQNNVITQGRLTGINDTTGDLTIRNIRGDQSGNYKVNIISSSTTVLHKKFHVNISGVFNNEKDGVKMVSVMNGDSVLLYTNVTEIQNDVPIEWMFGPQNLSIAKTDGKSNKISYNNDVRFKNKLYLDIQTGDLRIKNSSTEHSGLYQLKIVKSAYTIQKNFSVAVSGLSQRAVVGIVVSVLLMVAAAAVAGVIYRCHKKPKKIIREEDQNPNLLDGYGTELVNTS